MKGFLHAWSSDGDADTVEVRDDHEQGQEAQDAIAVFRRWPLPDGRTSFSHVVYSPCPIGRTSGRLPYGSWFCIHSQNTQARFCTGEAFHIFVRN